MGIVFTNQPIVIADTVVVSIAGFVSWLDANLQSAGWISAPITDGYEYTITSPQDISATVRIWDPHASASGTPYIQVQFQPDGLLHRLGVTAGRAYRLWADCCQFCIYIPGSAGATPFWNTLSGGVPCVTMPDLWSELPSSIWWSSSPGVTTALWNQFRGELENWSTPGVTYFSAHLNGATTFNTATLPDSQVTTESQLRILTRQTGTLVPGAAYLPRIARKRFVSGRPLVLDPYLSWGTSGAPMHTGQIWDAAVLTAEDADLADGTAAAIAPMYRGDDDMVFDSWGDSAWLRFTYNDPALNLSQHYGDLSGGLYLFAETSVGGAPRNYVY